MFRAISGLIILIALIQGGCSPKFPLNRTEGDQTYIRMHNGSGFSAVILDGDMDQLWILRQDTLYNLVSKNIEHIKVRGYSETQTFVYTASGALSLAIGSVGLATLDAFSSAFLGLGALCTIGAISSAKKYKFKPADLQDFSRLRLHFQYPQGLTQDQHYQILKFHNQSHYFPMNRN